MERCNRKICMKNLAKSSSREAVIEGFEKGLCSAVDLQGMMMIIYAFWEKEKKKEVG